MLEVVNQHDTRSRPPSKSTARVATEPRHRPATLRAATELFGSRGYGLVTVADIAAAAGVPPKTVFASVGSKREILDRIIDAGLAAARREEAMRQVLGLRTPREMLEALAAGTRYAGESQTTVHEAIRLALPVHEDCVALWERATRNARAALREAAEHPSICTRSRRARAIRRAKPRTDGER